MRNFKNSATYLGGQGYEENHLPSMTVPDQSLTVREILERFTRGLMPPISRELQFTEDLEDLRGLEPWQIYEKIDENKRELARIEAVMKERQKEELEIPISAEIVEPKTDE